MLAGSKERKLVQLSFSNVVAKAIPLIYEQVVQNPRRASCPLCSAKRSSPRAAIRQPAGSGVNGCVVWDLDLDATDPIGPRWDAVELLSRKPDCRQRTIGIAQLFADNLGVRRPKRWADIRVAAVR